MTIAIKATKPSKLIDGFLALERQAMVKAALRAVESHNKVRQIAFRVYEVTTPLQHVYRVTFAVIDSVKAAKCSCPSRIAICHHIASAYFVHCGIAKMKHEFAKSESIQLQKSQKKQCGECSFCKSNHPWGCPRYAKQNGTFDVVIEIQNHEENSNGITNL